MSNGTKKIMEIYKIDNGIITIEYDTEEVCYLDPTDSKSLKEFLYDIQGKIKKACGEVPRFKIQKICKGGK